VRTWPVNGHARLMTASWPHAALRERDTVLLSEIEALTGGPSSDSEIWVLENFLPAAKAGKQ